MDYDFAKNVVSLEKIVQNRNNLLKKKAMNGIDSKELNDYYNNVIKESFKHLTFLQKYIAEEFLGDTVIDCFALGMQASKLCLYGRAPDEIEIIYAGNLAHILAELSAKHEIYKYMREWDVYSLTILGEDLSNKWFRKGIFYGEKQRKLRLI
ncbi:MAG TPA: DUF2521 family protein [Bacillota bacterium]|nr:DUF2521 family protein [Bacillota bacterium]